MQATLELELGACDLERGGRCDRVALVGQEIARRLADVLLVLNNQDPFGRQARTMAHVRLRALKVPFRQLQRATSPRPLRRRQEACSSHPTMTAQQSGTRRRVGLALIVEDNPTLMDTLEQFLDDEGYSTGTARSVAGARHKVSAARPDVAIVDLTLTDGFAEELVGELAAAKIPTVIVSTFPLARLIAERHDVELVMKPFELAALLSAIARVRGPAASEQTG